MTQLPVDGLPIAFIEPLCRGLEHASFNAALLTTVASAFPRSPLTVYGEESHLAAVRDALQLARPQIVGRVRDWISMEVPARKIKGLARFSATRRLFASLDRLLIERLPAAIVVSTVDISVLALLKYR